MAHPPLSHSLQSRKHIEKSEARFRHSMETLAQSLKKRTRRLQELLMEEPIEKASTRLAARIQQAGHALIKALDEVIARLQSKKQKH